MSDRTSVVGEVLSGEAVAIDAQPVGLFLRALGAVIDVLVSVAAMTVFLSLRAWLADGGVGEPGVHLILALLSAVVSFVVLPCTIDVATHGRSLGRLAVGGRIVRLDGGAIGFRHAFVRALTGVLEIYMTAGAVAILTGAFSPRSQRLGDLLAGTYCQAVRTPRLPSGTLEMPPSLEEWSRIADVARMPDRLARRISQFLQNADHLLPEARRRIASDLLVEARTYVSPIPDVPAETVLIAASVVRRRRESLSLSIADDRAERLTGARIRL